MTATGLVLTVLAMVVSVESDTVTIDRGLADGLRPGDAGTNFYELQVAGKEHRVDVGALTIAELGAARSRLAAPAGLDVKVGSKVVFEVAAERISNQEVIAAARQHLAAAEAEALIARVLDGMMATTDDPAVRDALNKRLAPAGSEAPPKPERPAAPRPQKAPPPDPNAGMVLVAAGRYTIGAGAGSAEFFNEQPDHRVRLEAFWIDRRGRVPSEAEAKTYAEAQAECARQGKRLPTEQEWEAATGEGAIERGSFYEWTASWYQAYPGNKVQEEAYGFMHRVLRGDTEAASFSPVRRRFMAPELSHSLVGFRCARAAESGAS